MDAGVLTRTVWNGALDLLYPPRCAVCGRLGKEGLCGGCRAAFAPVPAPVCTWCGVPALRARCTRCEQSDRFAFVWARGAGLYDGVLRDAVHALKYDRRRRLAEPLGKLLGDLLATATYGHRAPDALVPIPLHPRRLAERGFNQSEMLARVASRRIGVPIETRALRRVRSTPPQVSLALADRSVNMRGAFVGAPGLVEDRAIIVVDDVITSGATVDAAARALLDAGARVVYAASVARAV